MVFFHGEFHPMGSETETVKNSPTQQIQDDLKVQRRPIFFGVKFYVRPQMGIIFSPT